MINSVDGFLDMGPTKHFFSGYTVDYGMTDKLLEILDNWKFSHNEDQLICEVCSYNVQDTLQGKTRHLVTVHNYNEQGEIRG